MEGIFSLYWSEKDKKFVIKFRRAEGLSSIPRHKLGKKRKIMLAPERAKQFLFDSIKEKKDD